MLRINLFCYHFSERKKWTLWNVPDLLQSSIEYAANPMRMATEIYEILRGVKVPPPQRNITFNSTKLTTTSRYWSRCRNTARICIGTPQI